MTLNLDDTLLIFIGGLVVVIVGMIAKEWFIKFLNRKFDSIYAKQELNEKEREQDNYITLRGQQVTCDCLHYLTLSILKGDHIEDIEAANKELDEYRGLLNRTITEKASRYNIKIDH